MGYNELGFLVVALLVLGTAVLLGRRPGTWYPANLLLVAAVLRIVGSTARYEILFRYYDGVGDAVRYYREGLAMAASMWSGGPSPLTLEFWELGHQWWGTVFLVKCSALALSVLGETLRGEFLLFSLMSFLGLYAIAQAFRNVQPNERSVRYAAWIWIWPSLWFWPSSLGKEALLILGIGLATLGYAGRGGAIRWIPFLAGLGFTFAIRPHVAAVLTIATLSAHWLGSWQRLTVRRLGEILLALTLVVMALIGMRAQFGLASADLEGMVEFVEYRAQQTLEGGSRVSTPSLSPAGVPLAFVNVWMRPFPWEAHNATAALAAMEIVVFWALIWTRRREVVLALRHWRRHRLLRFALPYLAVYTLMIGLTFGNLGLIARQRAPMFPFMFMVLMAARQPARERSVEGEAAPAAPPRHRDAPAPGRSPA